MAARPTSRPPVPVSPAKADSDTVPSTTRAQLFIGNVSPDADARYLERLFAVYGPVEHVDLSAPGPAQAPNSVPATHAIVHMKFADDADCAVAALHLRYCMCLNLPVIVLYAKTSQTMTAYGRAVGSHYRECIEKGEAPTPLPLESFDTTLQRSPAPMPPTDFTLPSVSPAVAAAAAAAAAAANQPQSFFGPAAGGRSAAPYR
eukprot:CAMPEP_0174853512 /NCGR_PEP_ID=MMETSP1114-20130205/28796_1 /TAXON_ID=312471 /ORGANISM="Neobodo designis, Strain CCAP 1951/1" /LENGTH=202 /DNA_ID=CAMNT_0016088167 /DNA_START=42 /DNA_END=650 /DNA_ORIENTATION=+